MAQAETRRVITEGNVTRIERILVEREVATDDFMAQIGKTLSFDSGPLPQGGAYIRGADPDGRPVQIYIVERPASPFGMTYRVWKHGNPQFNSRDDKENNVALALSWPRTLWCYKFIKEGLDTVHLVGIPSPLMDKYRDSPTTILLVPNTHGGGHSHFCTGQVSIPMDLPMPKRIAWLHNHLQGSAWNQDLAYGFPGGCGITDLFDWHQKTEKDRDYYKKIKFPTHQTRNVGGLIDMLMRRTAS